MRVSDAKSGVPGMVAATIASLCCLLPLAVIVLELGNGAFMMTTMRYRAVFTPVGVTGVVSGGSCTSGSAPARNTEGRLNELFWVFVIAGVVYLIRWLMSQGLTSRPESSLNIPEKR